VIDLLDANALLALAHAAHDTRLATLDEDIPDSVVIPAA
jgi:hypothetical protein